jgi:predicted DNA-binding protein (UPF0251 family)
MSRPKRKRFISNPPAMDGFKPFGIPISELEPVILLFEEYEALKLTDYDGLTQETAAGSMNVSRPTFTRIYEQARRSIAKAFVEGKAIIIEGGNFHSSNFWYRCDQCKKLSISIAETSACHYCQSNNLRLLNQSN